MPVFLVENPPVATVPNEWQILSNRFMSPSERKRISMAVSPRYISRILVTTPFICGWIFSFTDDSRLKSW